MSRCEADLTVINTSGLLTGAGRRLNAEKLRVVHLERWVGARRKPEGGRRAARRGAFRSYFAKAWPLGLAAIKPDDVELVQGQLLSLRGADGRDLATAVATTAGTCSALRVLAPEAGLAAKTMVPGMIALDASFDAVPLPPGSGSRRAT